MTEWLEVKLEYIICCQDHGRKLTLEERSKIPTDYDATRECLLRKQCLYKLELSGKKYCCLMI